MRALVILSILCLSFNAFTAKSKKLSASQEKRLGKVLPTAVKEIKKNTKITTKQTPNKVNKKSSQYGQKSSEIE